MHYGDDFSESLIPSFKERWESVLRKKRMNNEINDNLNKENIQI